MLSANKFAIWVLTGMVAVSTAFLNLYIFLMCLWNYKQNNNWTPSETIITALSVASGAHQLVCYFWMTMDEMDRECLIPHVPYSVMLLIIYSLKFTVVWTVCFLSFYYSTKLVMTTLNRCYTMIQTAILKHVTLVAALIPLCGLGTCMPMLVVLHPEDAAADEHNTTTHQHNQDCGIIIPDTPSGQVYEVMYLVLADVLPGLLMIKCCISISVHLAVHLRHMKASTNGAHSPKLGAQMRVIRMTLSLVFIFLCFVVVDLYVHYQISVNHENAIVLTFLFTSIYTTVSAMVLIYGKKTFWKALLHSYNVLLDGYPCLSCLKVPEKKKAKPSSPPKINN